MSTLSFARLLKISLFIRLSSIEGDFFTKKYNRILKSQADSLGAKKSYISLFSLIFHAVLFSAPLAPEAPCSQYCCLTRAAWKA